MPSGSHGGSAGSHSSGGSSFGGGGGSWGGGSHHRSRPSRPVRMRFRGHVYLVTNPMNGFLTCAIILLIFLFLPSIFGIVGYSQDIKKIETDYAYYQGMIAAAEEDPENLIVYGKVTDCFKNDTCDKWYITYRITEDNVILDGYSYSIYTMQEAQALLRKTIQIAVNSDVITILTDSIPMDYKYTTLSDDGEYVDAKENLRTFIIMVVVVALILGILIFFGVRKMIKSAKLEETSSSQSSASSTNSEPTTPKPSTWICEYCGSANTNSLTNCSQCKARRKY